MQRLGRTLTGEGTENPADAETEAEKYESKTRALRAQDEFRQTQEGINNPPSLREAQQKQIEEMANRAKEAEDRARDAEKAAREADATARKDAETAAAEARQEARTMERELHNFQLQMMTEKLDEVLKSRGGVQQQFNEYFSFVEQLAEKMGYQRPGATTPASDNPAIALEIAKIELERDRESRKFDLEMENSRRNWELEIKKLDAEQRHKEKELELSEARNQQLFTLPEAIGGAIAKGLLDRSKGGGAGEVARQAGGRAEGTTGYHVQVPFGQGGAFECPECKKEVGVGPTSTVATCVSCNRKFPVVRTQGSGGSTAEPEEEQ